MSSSLVVLVGADRSEVFCLLGVGEDDRVGESSKSRDAAWSGDGVVEWVTDELVCRGSICKGCSVPVMGVGIVWIIGGSDVSIATGSGGKVLSLLMALTRGSSVACLKGGGMVCTEFLILILPRFDSGGSRATGDSHAGSGRGLVFC